MTLIFPKIAWTSPLTQYLWTFSQDGTDIQQFVAEKALLQPYVVVNTDLDEVFLVTDKEIICKVNMVNVGKTPVVLVATFYVFNSYMLSNWV